MHLKCPFCNSYINKINNSDNGIKGHKLRTVSSSRKNDRIYILRIRFRNPEVNGPADSDFRVPHLSAKHYQRNISIF